MPSITISIASSRRSSRSVRQSLRELDRRALEISTVLLELGLEPREQGKRIRRRAGEPGQDPIVVQLADFLADCFMTVSPKVTWPSLAMTVCPP